MPGNLGKKKTCAKKYKGDSGIERAGQDNAFGGRGDQTGPT